MGQDAPIDFSGTGGLQNTGNTAVEGISEAKNDWMVSQTPQSPERADVVPTAFKDMRERLARLRASSTLFTSGQGVLERPSVASTVLLGS